jgi:hypothetical protein
VESEVHPDKGKHAHKRCARCAHCPSCKEEGEKYRRAIARAKIAEFKKKMVDMEHRRRKANLINPQDECVLCMSDGGVIEEDYCCLSCCHALHTACIEDYLRVTEDQGNTWTNLICPFCRRRNGEWMKFQGEGAVGEPE